MNRLLVAPWHGQIKGGQVHLPNGDTRSYHQPLNIPGAYFGPGDTHRITVPNTAPLTPAEVGSTPDGGFYRAGQALISGDGLYGVVGLSWIYQDPDGSRKGVTILNPFMNNTTTYLTLQISRFGEFGHPTGFDDQFRDLVIPKGRPVSGEDNNALFIGTNEARGYAVRLHAVSDTGRTAILTLSAYRTTANEQQARTLDTRPQHYAYVKVALSKLGDTVGATVTMLYTGAQIRTGSRDITGGAGMYPADTLATVEVSREPYLQNGEQIGDTVHYDWPPEVANFEHGNNRSLSRSQQGRVEDTWLMMVAFEGETPAPCRLSAVNTWSSNEMTFTKTTLSPRIVIEYFENPSDGLISEGTFIVVGSGSNSGAVVLSWSAPGSTWSRTVSYNTSSSFDGYDTTRTNNIDGETQVIVNGELLDMYYLEFPLMQFYPGFNFGFPHVGKYLFCPYTNNMVAVLRDNGDETAEFVSVLTPAGGAGQAGTAPADQRHYASYNPITAAVVVGSPELVNWA